MRCGTAELRAAEFPALEGSTYLNSASIGPLPERTRAVLDDWARRRQAPQRLPDKEIYAALDRSRALAARLLNCDATEIALAGNTTFGLNVAARALPLGPGDVVVVSRREFPANVYPWLTLRERGVTVELAPVTPEGWPDERLLLERVRDPRVKVLAVSLVQFHNGYAVDLAALSAATRAAGTWLVVDAIQGLGQLPVDLRATPVDILSTGAQKWLLSPWGSGFTYVRKELVTQLTPPMAGWRSFEGTDDYNRLTEYDDRWLPDARRFELITLPFQDLAAMNASLELLLDLGIPAIRAHVLAVAEPLLDLARRKGLGLASPVGRAQTAITCLRVPDGARAFAALRAAGVTCSLREGALRFSPHCFNTPEETARAAAVVDRAL